MQENGFAIILARIIFEDSCMISMRPKDAISYRTKKEQPKRLFLIFCTLCRVILSFVGFTFTQNAASCFLTPSNARWVTATDLLPSLPIP